MITRETIPAMLYPKKGLTFTHFGMENSGILPALYVLIITGKVPALLKSIVVRIISINLYHISVSFKMHNSFAQQLLPMTSSAREVLRTMWQGYDSLTLHMTSPLT